MKTETVKHTPGPWIYDMEGNYFTIGLSWEDDGFKTRHATIKIGQIVAKTVGISPICEANARLIAAAPELLEAAVYALSEDPGEWKQKLANAIAKAKGKL